nr:uncharacterized protein LOC105845381 [Hydra vulgaris]
MPNTAKNHQECRKSVCFLCFSKSKRKLTSNLKERCQIILKEKINFNDDKVPLGICEKCRSCLRRKESGEDITLPSLYKFETIKLRPETRDSHCNCLICSIGKLRHNGQMKIEFAQSSATRTPSLTVEKRCSDCFSIIGRGLSHNCTKGTLRNNLVAVVTKDPLASERIAALVVSNKAPSPHGTVRLSQLYGGRMLPVTPSSSSARQLFSSNSSISVKDLAKVQANTGLSNNGIKRLAATINQSTSQQIVEKNYAINFDKFSKQLVHHFTSSLIQDHAGCVRTVIHCKNFHELKNEIIAMRSTSKNHIVKVGIDGGGGFLKVTLGIIELNHEPCIPPAKINCTSKVFKDTGVKQQLVIAVSEELQESYTNVLQVFELIKLKDQEFVMSCDLKLANIICGLQAHSSAHPCTWCESGSKELVNQGKLRTFESLEKNVSLFKSAGSNIRKARDYKNVVHSPIFKLPGDTLVLNFLPPMELHLLIGVFNHLFAALLQVFPRVTLWSDALHIKQQPYHGGHFAGNESRKLLHNIDILQSIAEKHSCYAAIPFIDAFRKFNAVVSGCFGCNLNPNYPQIIEAFRVSYLALQNVSVTPKVHAVFFHVKDFIDRYGQALGLYSEQATEAMHHNFQIHWQRYKRPNHHPEYSKKLQCCIVDFNTKHCL